jgi:hypothetical protein
LKHATEFDHCEDLSVVLVDPEEIPKLIKQGRIGHPLVVVGLYHFDMLRRSA